MEKLIDLHLHLDGSVPYQTVRELLAKEGRSLPEADLRKRLSVSPDCRNLDEYLDKFDFPLSLMQTAKNFFQNGVLQHRVIQIYIFLFLK